MSMQTSISGRNCFLRVVQPWRWLWDSERVVYVYDLCLLWIFGRGEQKVEFDREP
jgi:hypothetical protein